MEEAAAHCSRTERRAEAAERELTKIKLLEFLQSRVGDTFTGVITGVQAFGVFVENPDLLIDGLVHISSLADDYYTFDREKWRLVGRRSGRVLRVGTQLDVRIAAVDIPRRQLDLVPVGGERPRKTGGKTKGDGGDGGKKGKSKPESKGDGGKKAKGKGSKKKGQSKGKKGGKKRR
jgi:ribonuclease R